MSLCTFWKEIQMSGNVLTKKDGTAVLLIDFSLRRRESNRSRTEIYVESLEDQYLKLSKRIPSGRRVSFIEFINTCFPVQLPKRYYISCPNFIREKKQSSSSNTTQFLHNLVIRPELTPSMREVLPDHQNVFLIGDIVEGAKVRSFQVKGIEFIDENMESPRDFIFNGSAVTAVERKNITLKNGISFMAADWQSDHLNFSDSIFTPDNIDTLIRDCYTVSNPSEALRLYDSWMDYFRAREYYLDSLVSNCFKADSVKTVTGYPTTLAAVKNNPSLKDRFIDGIKYFVSTPILSSPCEEAPDPIILIKTVFRFNKCALEKADKEGNDIIRTIRHLASGNVALFEKNPADVRDDPPENRNSSQNKSINIESRIIAAVNEIPPDEAIVSAGKRIADNLVKSLAGLDKIYSSTQNEERYFIRNKMIPKFSGELDIPEALLLLFEKKCTDTLFYDDAWIKIERESIEKILGESLNSEKKEKINSWKALFIKELNAYKKQLKENNRITREQKASALRYKADRDFEAEKNRLIRDETSVELVIYFRPYRADNKNSFEYLAQTAPNYRYLAYDKMPDLLKLERQKKAVVDFYCGFVKNPYLSTYLFSPEDLVKPSDVTNEKITWALDGKLNEKQQEAVRKSVESNGIFLLQGPPGTGKTQVIAEIVAQLVQRGKKVLISSETHKAIDNVFDRLPKIADIVPVRLIPQNRFKDANDYDPMLLVNNFYLNMRSSMERTISHFKNFNKMKDSFRDEMDRLKMLRGKINNANASYKKILKEIDELDERIADLRVDFEKNVEHEKILSNGYEKYVRTRNFLSRGFSDLTLKEGSLDELYLPEFIDKFVSETAEVRNLPYLARDFSKALEIMESMDSDTLTRELEKINPNTEMTQLELKKDEIKRAKQKCLDDFEEVIPEKQDEFDALQKELKKVINTLNSLKSQGNDSSQGANKLKLVFSYKWMLENQERIASEIFRIRDFVSRVRRNLTESLDKRMEPLLNEKEELQKNRLLILKEIDQCQLRINELNDSDLSQTIQHVQSEMNEKISNFFRVFNLSVEWNSTDEAFSLMEKEWDSLCVNAKQREADNKEKIPMYEKIVEYLSRNDVIQEDTNEFTDELFESANVFGITCTSRENFRFTGKANELIGMDRFNLKETGIDTVIVDEVSKSSFVDLLIPIMYGKSVVLVGDHRQLNPMYDLAKMRPEDFKNLDSSEFNVEMNRHFKNLYEISFFKKLFEKIRPDYKVMLNRQYRCHEDIMNVFNHFYLNELKLGYEGQNNTKQHNVTLSINGINIFRPDKRIYFVNCHGMEGRENQDSTSFINEEEAEVICKLVSEMNEFFKNSESKKQNKLSLGIISTYGAQAEKIKKSINLKKLTGFRSDRDERPIVSTVDDFQGDERDIIFVSMVRNNRYDKGTPEFIKNYQRINVALSRARRMLVVVGNRDFLIRKGVINLPDLYGRADYEQKGFRVYEKIITTIERDGKILDSNDILARKEHGKN